MFVPMLFATFKIIEAAPRFQLMRKNNLYHTPNLNAGYTRI